MDGVIGRGTVLSGRYHLTEPRPCTLPGTSEWAATDQILARPVVVHVFAAAGAGPALDAARRAALVTDPRLVRVLDVGSDDTVGYVITELVAGPTLDRLVAREPLSADQARAIVGEAAAALEVARRRGVHHLALRPSAVAVSDEGRVLVSGLALDAVLLGRPGGDARTTSRTDAADLVRLVYVALTGHWPGPIATADGLPTAPEVGGVPVPPAELTPGVPGDLNTLCVVTLGRPDDGPLSPADLVGELEPWGEIRVQGRTKPAFPPVVADPMVPVGTPGQVVRQSVRTAFAAPGGSHPDVAPVPVPGVVATGTPGAPAAVPPAVPPTISSRDAVTPAMGVPSAAAPPTDAADAPLDWFGPAVPQPGPVGTRTPAPTPAAGAPAPRPQPFASLPPTTTSPVPQPQRFEPAPQPFDASSVPPGGGDPFDFGQLDAPSPRRTGMGVTIAIVAVLVVVAIAFAGNALFRGHNATLHLGAAGGTTHQGATAGTASQQPSVTPTPTASTPTAPPVISGITVIDPTGGSGDHPELVGRAFDGNPSTYWMSMTYANDTFGGYKPALGLQLQLTQPATVHTVTLHVNGTGGNVEIRTGDATQPTGGTLLASGPMSPDAVFTLDPAQTTSSLVIWFTQLPTAAGGAFRIELTEIQLG